MKRKYAYVFPLTSPRGAQLEWSSESDETLVHRARNSHDKDLIMDFVEANTVGSFIKLSTGEMVFQTSS